jgi:glucose-6-phosphate 1-epimerase
MAGLATIDFHGLPAIQVRAPEGGCAIVTYHGAHIVSWVPGGSGECLYLSEQSQFATGAPIRGGVPVVFPQFATYGPLPHHGILRTRVWQLVEGNVSNGRARVIFRSRDCDETRSLWPYGFAVELAVELAGNHLEIAMQVQNTNGARMLFNAALHTYLRVSDIRLVQLAGLQGTRYRDRTDGDKLVTDPAVSPKFGNEIDRIYIDAPDTVHVRDVRRSLIIRSTGFRDLVVWSPGRAKAATLPDMPADGHLRMLCVEAAAIATPVVLHDNERWIGRQMLVAASS